MEAAEGVDTLVVHLLADLTGAKDLERFAAAPNQVAVEQVSALLRERGKFHSLALLYAGHGRPREALLLWKVFPVSLF